MSNKKGVEVQFNDRGFQNMLKAIKKNPYVKVGVLASTNSRDDAGLSNATIGLKHEFGSFTERIPRRSFLRFPIEHQARKIVSEWSKIKNKFSKDLVNGSLKDVMAKLGVLAEIAIQEAFASRGFGQWKPNSYFTIKQKGSASPLIATAELRKSVTSKVENA